MCLADFTKKPTPVVEGLNGLDFLDLRLGQRHLDLETTATSTDDATCLQIGSPGAFGGLNSLLGR
jgi:hypothetical protein